jgi:hypothetical protein
LGVPDREISLRVQLIAEIAVREFDAASAAERFWHARIFLSRGLLKI